MKRFVCDDKYKEDLREFGDAILQKYGTASQAAEREILCLSEAGNTAALIAFADLLFYKKLMRKNPYREAFELYLKAGGLSFGEGGGPRCSGAGHPMSFWHVGYYLMNYRRRSFLKACEPIEAIDKIPLEERLKLAFELSISAISYTGAPGAVNLAGRILDEAAGDAGLFTALKGACQEALAGADLSDYGIADISLEDQGGCAQAAEVFFNAAAEAGYVYACNNLAAREADRIIELSKSGAGEEELDGPVRSYAGYLQRAADKYEPYAANRLGIFYIEGEIRGSRDSVIMKKYVNAARAKEYFLKATVFPDANSGWAYLNLITHFRNDYIRDLDLFNEHMAYIEKLNPAAYDIAMDM